MNIRLKDMRLFLTSFFILLFLNLSLAQQQASALERAAQEANDRREAMTLYYQAAEKYMPTNPSKAATVAHQAYLIATELKDNIMAARAAYMNGEGYARQNKYEDARLRFERGKIAAVDGKDYDFGAKCLDRMAQMARYKGNTQDAETYKVQAANLRRRLTEGGTAMNSGTGNTNAPPANRPTPTSQAELNAVKEQYRVWFENLQQQRRKLEADVAILQRERQALNTEMQVMQKRQQDLTSKTQAAQQTIEEQKGALATIENQKQELDRVAARKQKLLELISNEKSLDSLAFAQERQEQEYSLQKARNFRNVLILVLAFAVVIVGLIYRRFLENQKQKKILEEKNRIIEDERQRSDELLLNILPASIASELKTDGKAKAHRYEQASVMFIDFKSFTKISEQLTPEDLVHELDTYFKAFDFIIGQYKLEKIKTIGDAYMVASGLSDRITTPLSMVKAALEIQEFLNDMRHEKTQVNKPYFEARIGIHAGPVVAGVVGVKKFAYDIWGDTVNIAARVQDACEPGRINISEKVFDEIRYSFQCHYRGKLPAKNKGNIDMYYVEKALKN
jgi:class 3 adenylate cyclase